MILGLSISLYLRIKSKIGASKANIMNRRASRYSIHICDSSRDMTNDGSDLSPYNIQKISSDINNDSSMNILAEEERNESSEY